MHPEVWSKNPVTKENPPHHSFKITSEICKPKKKGLHEPIIIKIKGIRYLSFPLDSPLAVTGAPYREVNSKVATAPKLKVEDKDRANNSRRIKNG